VAVLKRTSTNWCLKEVRLPKISLPSYTNKALGESLGLFLSADHRLSIVDCSLLHSTWPVIDVPWRFVDLL